MSISEKIGLMVGSPITGFSVTIGRNSYTDGPAVQIKFEGPVVVDDIIVDDPWLLDSLAIDLLTARQSLIRRQEQEARTARNVAVLAPEPYCNHDAVAVKDGVCECGVRVG